jgi:hyperosmotically inducible protein
LNEKAEDMMQMRQVLLRGLMGAALLLGPVAAVQAKDNQTPSERLEQNVEKGLGQVEALRHVDVDVDQGVVTLKGEVASQAEKARAERIARTAGAKVIVNKVEIDSDKAIAEAKDRGEAKKDQIDDQATRAKHAVDRQTDIAKDRAEHNLDPKAPTAEDSSHKAITDPLVTAKVKTKIIRDDLLDKSDINVDTDADGLVTLKGTVTSDAAKTRALELARTTEGVRKVVDRLEVKAPIVK